MTRFEELFKPFEREMYGGEVKDFTTADGKRRRKVKVLVHTKSMDFLEFYAQGKQLLSDTELFSYLSLEFPDRLVWTKTPSLNDMSRDDARELLTDLRKSMLKGRFQTNPPKDCRIMIEVARGYRPGKRVEDYEYNKVLPKLDGFDDEYDIIQCVYAVRALERLDEVCNPRGGVFDKVIRFCDELKKGGFVFDEKHRREFEVRVRLMDEDEELHRYVVKPNGLIDCTHLVNALCGDPCLYISDNKKGWCDALRDEYVKGTVGAELKGTKIDSGVLTVDWENNRKVPLELKKILGREEFKKKESEMLKENKED